METLHRLTNGELLFMAVCGILLVLWALPSGCDDIPRPVQFASTFARNLCTAVAFTVLVCLLVVIAAMFFLLALVCGLVGWVGYTLFTICMKLPTYNYPAR